MRQTIFKGILKFMVITDTLAMLSLCIILASSVAEFPGLVTAVIQREVGGWSCGRQHPALYGSFRKKQKKKQKGSFSSSHIQNGEQCRRQRGVCLRFYNASNLPIIQTFLFFHFELILNFSQEAIYYSNQSRIINNKGCLLFTKC